MLVASYPALVVLGPEEVDSVPHGNPRPVVVATRLNELEVLDLDRRRGPLTRADFLRWLLLRARREGVSFGSDTQDVPSKSDSDII